MTRLRNSTQNAIRRAWPVFLLVAYVLVIYSQAASFGFVLWDDAKNIYENPILKSGSFMDFWQRPYYAIYTPLIYTYWHLLNGPANPQLLHVLNIFFHLANALLVMRLVSQRAGREVGFLAAVFFAAHPIQVETVAWASGARDLLSTFFALTSLLLSDAKTTTRLVGSTICFGLALLCKPAAVALPLVLIFFDLLQAKEFSRLSFFRAVISRAPMLAVALAMIGINSFAQQSAISSTSIADRFAGVFHSYGFYVVKFFWPIGFTIDYGLNPGEVLSTPFRIEYLATLAILGLSAWSKTRQHFLVPTLVFFLFLLPVSGIVSFAFQFYSTVADRYAYLPMVGLCWALAKAINAVFLNLSGIWHHRGVLSVSLGFGCCWSVLSFQQVQVWRDDRALFSHALKVNPKSFTAHTNLGIVAMNDKDLPRSLEHFEKAVALRPTALVAVANRLVILNKLERHQEVAAFAAQLQSSLYQAMRSTDPSSLAIAYNVVGLSQVALENYPEGFTSICSAHRLNPSQIEIEKNLHGLSEFLTTMGLRPAPCRN